MCVRVCVSRHHHSYILMVLFAIRGRVYLQQYAIAHILNLMSTIDVTFYEMLTENILQTFLP